jgi:DNA-directed RNA polymerase specialized sigma24 family protein
MDNKEKVKKELALYKLREVESEDMKLKIEELELGEKISSPGFEERVQTSTKCKNNDSIMYEIESLKNKIKFNEIANKRVDNALKLLSEVEIQVVKMVLIDKKSISEAARKLYRERRQVYNIQNQALSKIKIM